MESFVADLFLLLLISTGQVYGGKALQRKRNKKKRKSTFPPVRYKS